MQPESCAVVFDLDDTLYPRRRFVLSGFVAVTAYVERSWGIDRRAALAVLTRACRTAPGCELQVLTDRFGLPAWLVPQLVEVIRAHEPCLRMPLASRRALATLREGWRLGVVTNGPPDIQARKVRALGLEPLVDTVVYAHAVGQGIGKPDRAPFLEAARRLRVRPARIVFVGDDPVADIAGAQGAGMRAIHLRRRARGHAVMDVGADLAIDTIDEVPSAAMGLLDGRRAYVG